jgi:ribose transport system substrate-binding protein
MKHTLTVSFAIVAILLMSITASFAQQSTPEPTPEGFQLFTLAETGLPALEPIEITNEWTIGWAMNADAFPFSVAMNTGTDMAVEAMPINNLHVDGRGDTQTQIAQLEDFITQEVDGIVLVSWDANAVIPQVEAAAEAGIPLLTCFNDLGGEPVENYPGSISLIGVDEVEVGVLIAQEVLALLPDGGQVAIIEGAAGFQASIDRSAGFIETLAANEDIEIVATQPGDWSRDTALAVAENLLLANPDLDVIYTHDDSMALGAIDALKNAGTLEDVAVFGIGGSAPGIEAIRAGEMYGTVFYSPVSAGYLCTKALIAHLEGEIIPEYILMPTPLVTADNVDQFEGEW